MQACSLETCGWGWRHSATNSDGTALVYHLSPPTDFEKGEKYPLVIIFTGVRWRPQEGNVPAAGSFLASCNVVSANEENIVTFYQAAIKNPSIDTNRVYLLGVSGGAALAVRLLEDRPELWRGAILLSPVTFPDVSRLKASRILIDSGLNDNYLKQVGGLSRLTKFQDAAALAGIPVTLSVNKDASHVYRSKAAKRQRVRQILEFVAADN